MKMKHLLAGEHPNAMDVTTRYKSAPKVVKLFVKHNCVRHIRSRAGSKTCFYHGAHHYTYSVSSRPMRMCGELVAGVLGTKAGRPRPFPTTTQLGGGALTKIWGPKVDIVAVLGPQDHIISEDPVRRHFYLCQERLAIIRIERGHFVDGLIIKVCSN